MRKEMTKIFAISLLSILLISFVAGVASAQGTSSSNNGNFISDKWNEFWSSYQDTTFDKIFLKYLFLILIIFLIYSAMATANFPHNSGLRFIISAIVGFIATVYVTPTEFFTIAQGYSALAITLGILFPFLILFFFSVMTVKEGGYMGYIFQILAWFIFAAYLFLRLAEIGIANTPVGEFWPFSPEGWSTLLGGTATMGGQPISSAIIIIMTLAALAALIFAIFNSHFRKWTMGRWFEHLDENIKKAAKESRGGMNLLRATARAAGTKLKE